VDVHDALNYCIGRFGVHHIQNGMNHLIAFDARSDARTDDSARGRRLGRGEPSGVIQLRWRNSQRTKRPSVLFVSCHSSFQTPSTNMPIATSPPMSAWLSKSRSLISSKQSSHGASEIHCSGVNPRAHCYPFPFAGHPGTAARESFGFNNSIEASKQLFECSPVLNRHTPAG
jgi:hypothetical protein